MDAIEPSNYEQAGWSDLTYEYVQALCAALDAEEARADAAEAALKTAREAIAEIEAVVGCLEGKDKLDRELIRNITESLALIKEPRP